LREKKVSLVCAEREPDCMSETSPTPNPKKEALAPRQESLRAEFVENEIIEDRAYGEALLSLIARDPESVFCYWEFRPAEHPAGVGKDGSTHFHIRIFREGGALEHTVEILTSAGDWFIPVSTPDCGYFAELGFFAEGVWCFLARSGIARTPPKSAAINGGEVFATIPPKVSLRELQTVLGPSAAHGEDVAQTAARVQSSARAQTEWTREQEELLAKILAEEMERKSAEPANSATLASRVRQRLAAAEEAAAPGGPMPPMPEETAPGSPGSHWPRPR